MSTAAMEMPQYQCHKQVWALKIVEVVPKDGKFILRVEPPFTPLVVDADWHARHRPEAGGYYVVYEDGYKSYSPAEPFEGGYTPIRGDTVRFESILIKHENTYYLDVPQEQGDRLMQNPGPKRLVSVKTVKA